MPKMIYKNALGRLSAAQQSIIESAFNSWQTDPRLLQVRENVLNETALSESDFAELLTSFAEELDLAEPSNVAWQNACRKHKRKGRSIPSSICPLVLGRAKGFEHHVAAIMHSSRGRGDLSRDQARSLLYRFSRSSTSLALLDLLCNAPLGNHDLVWATFDTSDSSRKPFESATMDREDLRTALGLGEMASSEILILLCWGHAESGCPPLHRPTVADAETYAYFRPFPDPNSPWGMTEPLRPNPKGISPQPEVVLQDPTSVGLRLPVTIL